ncbi:hypothetical protein EAF04_009713 [Stromatinia cepivora]|nr:hypothetical protein EAF04_009713 [Stromatinia cepivora]
MDLDGDFPYNPLLEKEFDESVSCTDPMLSQKPMGPKGHSCTLSIRFLGGILLLNFFGIMVVASALVRKPLDSECRSPTDKLLGDIPWVNLAFHADERFVAADSVVDAVVDDRNKTVWNDLYPSAWLAVSDPQTVSYGGGVKLSEFAQDESMFKPSDEGFVLAVMHQIHCVAVIKHAIGEYQGKYSSETPPEHLDHCIEYLRQAVMCHGDLTLEGPNVTTYPQRVNGDGSEHRCRDWGKLIQAVRERAIKRGENGWLKVWGDH